MFPLRLFEWGNTIYGTLEGGGKTNFEDHFVIGVEEMKIPSAGKQITLLHDDSLSKNLKLVSVQPPARQAVIYMTMWVPELSFPYLKVGGTKTNHTEASVLKIDVRPLIEVSTAIQIYLPAYRTSNCFLYFSSSLSWPLFLTVCLPFFPTHSNTFHH